jgi:hypothetical protein
MELTTSSKSDKTSFIEFNLKMSNGTYKVFWLKEQLGRHPGIRRGFFGESMGMHTTFYEAGGMHHEVGGVVLPHSEASTPAFKDIDEAWQIGYSAMPVKGIPAKNLSTKVEVVSDTPNRIITLDLGDYSTSLDMSVHLVRKTSQHSFINNIMANKKNVIFGDNLSGLVGMNMVNLECFPEFKLIIFLISGNIAEEHKSLQS